MNSDALMRLLIPEGKVNETADALGVSSSLVYQERRPAGNSHTHTGTRNCIARLDIICALALSHTPEAVRLLAKRYRSMYDNAQQPPERATLADLLDALSVANREVGEAFGAISARRSVNECSVEVTQAKESLERCLRIIESMEGQSREC